MFIDIEIKNYLQEKFKKEIQDVKTVENLLFEIENLHFKKTQIKEIANNHCYYHTNLEKFYKTNIFARIFHDLNVSKIADLVVNHLDSCENVNKLAIKFIEKDLRSIIEKSFLVATKGGFSSDLQGSEMGLRVANEGDSAQFLFIARAILAGFNRSNVDVRSSRYDAIIDYNSVLLRLHIKGISCNKAISFFDRDRGGQGIDHKHERNKGKRITSSDCDIYVAVDKQMGIYYIIPMYFADNLDEKEAKNVKLDNIKLYLENWDVVKDVANFKKV